MRVPTLGVTAVCTAIAITVAAVRLLAPVPLEVLDRKFLDFRHLSRGPVAATDQFVIVAIDEFSLARLGRWPWPRARLAELVERLDAAGVAAIGVDVVLDQPATAVDRQALEAAFDADPQRSAAALRDVVRNELDDDARLAAALHRSDRVVLAHFFEFGGAATPDLVQATAGLPELTVLARAGTSLVGVPGPPAATRARLPVAPLAVAAAGSGHINFAPDPDGLYRRLPIAVRVGDRLVPSLALELLRVSRGAAASVTVAPGGVRTARVGALELPVDGAGQLWPRWRRARRGAGRGLRGSGRGTTVSPCPATRGAGSRRRSPARCPRSSRCSCPNSAFIWPAMTDRNPSRISGTMY